MLATVETIAFHGQIEQTIAFEYFQERINYEVSDLELNQQIPANGQINYQFNILVGQQRRAVILLQVVPRVH